MTEFSISDIIPNPQPLNDSTDTVYTGGSGTTIPLTQPAARKYDFDELELILERHGLAMLLGHLNIDVEYISDEDSDWYGREEGWYLVESVNNYARAVMLFSGGRLVWSTDRDDEAFLTDWIPKKFLGFDLD